MWKESVGTQHISHGSYMLTLCWFGKNQHRTGDHGQKCYDKVVLNLWATTHFRVKQPFPGGLVRPSANTDIYIIIDNSSDISYEVATKIILSLGRWPQHEELY